MAEKVLMKGNELIAEAAVRCGVNFFSGYPITPQTELLEYMSWRLPQAGGHFIQAESEVASSAMLFAASTAGARAMTATSGPGLSLMAENLALMCLSRLPGLIVDVQRAATNITPEQSDYNFVVKGVGHNGMRGLVYAPASLQEAVSLVSLALDKADEYMVPAFLMTDGMIGQMEEPAVLPEYTTERPFLHYTAPTGCAGREPIMGRNQPRHTSINESDEDALEKARMDYYRLYREWVDTEAMYEEYMMDGAEYVIFAYGGSARIMRDAVKILRERGVKAGMFRPITLHPFPEKQVAAIRAKAALSVEMAIPPMFYDDVRLHLDRSIPLRFYNRCGGNMVDEYEAVEAMLSLIEEVK